MKVLILNVGEEVLQGKVLNTNASFLAQELRAIGFDVAKVVVVGDREHDLKQEILQFQNSDFDILITTGGLGPTHDDLTKEVLFETLHLQVEENSHAKLLLEQYFGNQIAPCNLKQTLFPQNAFILENKLGTADGAIIEHDSKTYIVLVGPPHEMNPMVKDDVIPYLTKKTNESFLSQDYIVMGNGESFFEELLLPLMKQFPQISLSPYASLGRIRYQIVSPIKHKSSFEQVNSLFVQIMNDYIISDKEEEIENVVVSLLIKQNLTITFGESCTGGMLASRLINVPNASLVLKESFVVYSNEAKSKYLHVAPQIMEQFGAVSEQTVHEMLQGLFLETKADVCVAVSGIAGPSGGSAEKPVGLVYFGIKFADESIIEHKTFKGSRNMIRSKATLWILYRLWQLLKNN